MIIKEMKLKIEKSVRRLKLEVGTIYYASRHEETPMLAKIISLMVVGYALSPIDLIPDFIPVLGYLDDIIILPLGIAIVMKLIPKRVIDDSREKAKLHFKEDRRSNWIVGIIIICIWIAIVFLIGYEVVKMIKN